MMKKIDIFFSSPAILLCMNKKELNHNTDLVFGIHPIVELLKAKKRRLTMIYTTKPVPKAWNLLTPLLQKSTTIQYVTRDVLHKIANSSDHQGVIGVAIC